MRMNVPFIASTKIVSKVISSSLFKLDTKKAIKVLEGRRFNFVENFLKELFTIKAMQAGQDINDKIVKEKILLQAVNSHDNEYEN